MRAEVVRNSATYLWVLGLAMLSADFFSFHFVERTVSLSYGAFLASFLCMAWAEKREFSTRIFLYRLHDVVIFGVWRYLFLALIWITLVSQVPIRGILPTLQVSHLWFSFFCIGINAQFLFCDRSGRMVFLRPDRLAVAFQAFGYSLLLTFAILQLQLLGISTGVPEPKQKSLFVYFLLGLPFLMWDVVRPTANRFLPRLLSLSLIVVGLGTVLLLGRKLYMLSALFALLLLLSAFLYKGVKPKNWWITASAALFGSFVFSLTLRQLLLSSQGLAEEFQNLRLTLEREAMGTFLSTWQAWSDSHWYGGGLGTAERKGLWARVIAESGLIGLVLYFLFFGSLLFGLYSVRKVPRVAVSHASLCSLLVFLFFLSFYLDNPANGYLWVWYGLWALFASTPGKRIIQ
jgi:hypothetical protein